MAAIAETSVPHMVAIGVITVRWSAVDGLLYNILAERLNLKAEAERLRSKNAGRQRLEFFRAILKDSALTLQEESCLKCSVDCLIRLYDDRNSIAHGQYGIITGEDGSLDVAWSDIALYKRGNSSRPHLEPAAFTVDHLEQHADEVYKAARPLRDFLSGHRPRKARSRG